MPSREDNPNCEQTYASFRLAGDRLIAAEVTRRLGLEPDFVAEKGEIRSAGKARSVAQPIGVWSITSRHALETTSIERHLLFLLQRLDPVSDAIQETVERQKLEAVFSCYWLSATGHGGPGLTPETLRRIADLGARLEIDFYGPFPETDADDD